MRIKRKTGRLEKKESGRVRPQSSNPNYDQRRYLYHSVSLERVKANRESLSMSNRNDESKSPTTEIVNKSKYVSVSFIKYWMRRLIIIVIISLLVTAGIRFSQLSPSQVYISATNNQLDSEYNSVVYGVIKNSWFNGNKITLNESEVTNQLKSRFPDITSVGISDSIFKNALNINIVTSPASIFLSTTYNGGLVNDQGRVVDTSISANNSKLTIVNFPVNLKLKDNEYVLSATNINFINTINYELKSKNITVNHYVILPDGNELDAYISSKNYYVKFNLQTDDPINQSGTFLALYHYLLINNINPTEYIDARIDGRAYFK